MTIVEKAAYLRGLTEGLGVDPESREGRLWGALNDLLADMAHEIEDLQSADLDRADAIEELADELSYLEELVDAPEDSDDADTPSPRPGCPGCGGCFTRDDDYADLPEATEDDGIIYDAVCPVCGQEISFSAEVLEEGSIECPGCGEMLEFDLGDDDEEADASED
ncbi:MAG: hypothetical protein IJV41_11580 [Oscillospiraceae bacterium]|nr:hypothetical protein [Oscillospiraceae bacterium]